LAAFDLNVFKNSMRQIGRDVKIFLNAFRRSRGVSHRVELEADEIHGDSGQEQDGGYVATVPILPGCVSQGETRDEVLSNIQEAIELYVDDCRAAGDPVPLRLPA
jgi:predicted RNase H-like HicB family nuclease